MIGYRVLEQENRSHPALSPDIRQHLLVDILGAIIFITIVVFVITKIRSHGEKDASKDCLIIRTPSGVIEGTLIRFRIKGETYSTVAFYGIPFADPPTGANRFAEPMCAKPWSGIFNATYMRPPCAQLDNMLPKNYTIDASNTTEDCLHINMWVPGSCVRKARRHAIVFWLYGGAFVGGGNSYDYYDGRFVAGLGDVVVASPNYRLNLFGFLNSGTDDLPGNMGLHDQLLAARWLHTNAEYFGGDSDRILAIGQSAGGISFSLMMISPLLSQYGTFRRFYLMSATAKMPFPSNQGSSARKNFAYIAENSGCRADSVVDSLRCLKEMNTSTLLEAFKKSAVWLVPSFVGPLLPGSANDLLKRFLPSRAGDAVITTTLTEGGSFFELLMPGYIGSGKPMTKEMIIRLFEPLLAGVDESLVQQLLYFVGMHYDLEHSNYKGLIDLIGDLLFRCPTFNFGKTLAGVGRNVYHMVYAYKPSFSVFSVETATHGDDLGMLFGLPFLYPHMSNDKDKEVSYRMMLTVANFAKNGSLPTLSDGSPWPLFSKATDYSIVEQTSSGYSLSGPSHDCTVPNLIDQYMSGKPLVKREGTSIPNSSFPQNLKEMLASLPALGHWIPGGHVEVARIH